MVYLIKIFLIFLLAISLNSCNLTSEKSQNQTLAIIVNQADPLSVKIGHYYRQKHHIPKRLLIEVKFAPHRSVLSPQEFQKIQAQVQSRTPANIQSYALTWARPYRVGCMSITSAFALGFDATYCAKGCTPTKPNPYFHSHSSQPYTDFGIRTTMAIAATNFEQAKQLIDRGVASDATYPQGTAYLMDTTDKARNVRAALYNNIKENLGKRLPIKVIKANSLTNQSDVLFYFTGLANIPNLETNRFVSGAIGDHLTSFGGQLTDSRQMSSLRWLEAGATGSYGTVVEPCNFPQKFPHPGLVMYYYLHGDTLINAYWKSVAWVGQGLFIGEPLARPFGRSSL
ncbi:conserved hypothetical protein [Rippkaea orientalis PCC 8801]|uniref:TIGR03790 family protein n=1 Tax=Rippkaea orientalis (strain PCC 8801 / RF-1) TaxID=41431 RepID=B7K479_RIPO1|nr:TIGR03790 family protein [Rippkaea orientalis]ACK67785.1 conserved hypothetical protein [Rippkaea orientalis PCC 8801]